MFRRRWSGLPEDAAFPATMGELGLVCVGHLCPPLLALTRAPRYFVNDEDEIRSIENPNAYFKYFVNKNQRVNDRQRFCFNGKTIGLPTTHTARPATPSPVYEGALTLIR